MNLFVSANLFLSLASLSLAVLVFFNARSKVHWLWGVFNVAVGVFGLGMFYAGISKNYSHAFWGWKIALFGVANIGLFFYLVVSEFCQAKNRIKWSIAAVVHGILFSVLALTTNFIFGSMRIIFNDFYYYNAGVGWNIFFAIWMVFVIQAFIDLFRFIQTNTGIKATQARYLFFGMLLGFSSGATASLPSWGIGIYPAWHFLICVYAIICTYAIFKHQLMEIEVVIRRTAVFAGLFAFVYGTFTIVTMLSQEFFRNSLGWNNWIAMIPTVAIITFALRPLETFLTNVTEKFLFQKKINYIELLKTFTNEILTVLDLQKLMDQTVTGLVKIIKLESACVLLFDKESKVYKMVAGNGVKEKNVVFKPDDTLISYLKAAHGYIIKDKNVDKMDGHSTLRDDFKRLNAQICLPILLHDELIGILCLGMKKSGEDYTQEDIDILSTLARTEAIAISNAQLFDELSKTQAEAAQREKMAVIGTLAAGINHEICNPLGIVRGQCEMFLLNLRDGFYKGKSQEEVLNISSEIMNKVIKETDRATGITKKLSSFAKPSKRSEMETVFIEKETEEVLSLLGHDLKLNNIEIQTKFPAGFPAILADKKQIQEVLFNIIRNAAQAMDKKEGRIVVSGLTQNGAVIARIADNGSGIPPDKINQIFNPFYTTKAPGKGTGLGLFIVKQVVERNKGTIAVESEAGTGTTFTLSFPAAVREKVAA